MIEYRGYKIYHDPPPIPSRSFDWQFHADGYDGAEDSKDTLCGYGQSEVACKNQINDLIQEAEWQLLAKPKLTEASSGS